MASFRSLKWIAGALAALVALVALFITIAGWNWLRGPVERLTLEKTGRALVIHGDLGVKFGWPLPRVRADAVTFANPAWAREKQMVAADAVEITVNLPQLLLRHIVFPEVRLERPVVFLEQAADGRKNWLLDINQQDEGARIHIDRLALDQGTLGYDNAGENTSLRSALSTSDTGVSFSVQGRYKGLPLKAHGSGGPVLAMRDESTPYPLTVDATIGRTAARADGTITSLLKFSAIDMQLAVSGTSLDQLYPLLGIAVPATRPYATSGHLLHSGKSWRYEKFSGRIGASDIAGTATIDTSGKRPALKGELASNLLDIDDLGPLIGERPGKLQAAKQAVPSTAQARMLPDIPFRTERWNSVDAEITLKAKSIRRAKELPLEDLIVHLSLLDSLLTLDPLNFGVAGGHLDSVISLAGKQDPIQAHARVKVKKVRIAKLLPTVDLNKNSSGELNGDIDLAGKGNSVGRMLASANGKVALIVSGGEISKLMMEKAGLHLWEILELKLSGDRLVKLRCAVADFDVRNGTLHTDALIFDTEITTIIGSGSIDLAQEKLDLTLNQKTKNTSPLALRSPIYVRGSIARPTVEVDKRRVAMRAIGAIALGVVNPLLTLIPLIDAGPGKDSDCGQLVREARALPDTVRKP